MGLARAFERIADEIAGIILILGGMYILLRGFKQEGIYFANLGAMYLFYRRVRKGEQAQGGLPYER